MKRKLYSLAQWTWGFPQTLIGAGLFLKNRKKKHFRYKGATVTEWDRNDGVSLGKFIFVPENTSEGFILEHEYGHGVQSLILGPAYLLLVGLPSLAWNRLPYFERRRRKTGRSYYSVVFERTANGLGARAAGKGKMPDKRHNRRHR